MLVKILKLGSVDRDTDAGLRFEMLNRVSEIEISSRIVQELVM